MRNARAHFLAISLSLTFLISARGQAPATADAPEAQNWSVAPVNPAFTAHLAQRRLNQAPVKTESSHGLGYAPGPVDFSYLRALPAAKKRARVFPATFDLRTAGRVTSVKDQGTNGSCWAHAGMASIESCLRPGETWDFSENNLVNLSGFDWGWQDGGNPLMVCAYLARWGGPMSEADDPYPNPGGSPANLPVRKHLQNLLIVPARTGALDNDGIKAAIQDHGAVSAGYLHDDYFFNGAHNSYYFPYPDYGGNHNVVLVGWDDNFDRNWFSPFTPSGNGAFIAKNSWGTSWGDAGYFYISYYDQVCVISDNGYVNWDAQSTNNYSRIYQYDPLGWVASIGAGSNDYIWAANVFAAVANETLAAVGFYAVVPDTAYELSIYTGVTAGAPQSGTLAAAQNGTVAEMGFRTVELTNAVNLVAGERFSLVIKITSPGSGGFPMAVEYRASGYSSGATAAVGEGFASRNGSSWQDATAWGPDVSLCLKGYAALPSAPPAPSAVEASDGIFPDRVRVTWSAAAEATGYEVWRATNAAPAAATRIAEAGAVLEYDDVSAVADTNYWYWVKATNAAGASAFSPSNSGYRADHCTLTVNSIHGQAQPPVGSNTFSRGSTFLCSITNVTLLQGATQAVCAGWTMQGHQPASGGDASFALTLTNNATLTWLWKTNYLLQAGASGPGTVAPTGGWYEAGSGVVVTAMPNAHAVFAGWSGDVQGNTNSPATTQTMDRARSLVARFSPTQVVLTVTSAHAGASPGTQTADYGTALSQFIVNSPVTAGSTQYVCSGGTVAGNAFTPVNPTNVTLTLTNNAALDWSWQTNYLLQAGASGPGTVAPTGGWYNAGSTVIVTAAPDAHAVFAGWSGDVQGDTNSAVTTQTMDRARSLVARFAPTQVVLTVTSAHAGASPGTQTADYNAALSQFITNSPLSVGTTQYVCSGGAVAGNDFVPVSATNVTLALTNNATLAWSWATNYWLDLSASNGTVNPGSGWFSAGSNVAVVATPYANAAFDRWGGDTGGCAIAGATITIPVSRPRAVVAICTNLPGTPIAPAALQATDGAYTDRVEVTWSGVGGADGYQVLRATSSVPSQAAVLANVGPVTRYDDTGVPAGTVHWYWVKATNVAGASGLSPSNDGYRAETRTLAVNSAHGAAVPPAGANAFALGAPVNAWIADSPVTAGSTQYVCSGGTVAGNAFTPVNPTNVTLTLTNNAALDWSWQTNYLLQAGASGPGTVAPTGGWYNAGSTVIVTAAPDAHAVFAGWSGDVQGDTNSAVTTQTMDRARSLTANFSGAQVSLTVESHHGGASPGNQTVDLGTFLDQKVTNSPVTLGATQYVCNGGAVVGNAFTPVNSTNVTLTLTNHATLIWQWTTNYLIGVSNSGPGAVSTTGGWQAAGACFAITATPSSDGHFDRWIGDVPPAQARQNPLTLPINRPRDITAVFSDSVPTNVVVFQESFDDLGGDQWLSSLGWETYSNAWIATDTILSSCLGDRAIIGTNAIHNGDGDMFGAKLLDWSHHGDKLIFKYVGVGGDSFDSGIYVREASGQWTCGWLCGRTDDSGWFFHDGYGAYDEVGVHTDVVYAVTYLDFRNQQIWGTLAWDGGAYTTAVYGFTRSATSDIQVALYEDYRHPARRGVDVDDITVEEENPRPNTLTIASGHGTASPPVGVYTQAFGSVLSNRVSGADIQGSTQYVCAGWTLTGNEPASGSGTNFVMTFTNTAVLTWLWNTNYWLQAQAIGPGTVAPTGGWYAAGTVAVVTAAPNAGAVFAGWSGDVQGDTNSLAITQSMTVVRSLTANFRSAVASNVHYVVQSNPTPVSPFITWDTAATVIQDAVDVAASGDLVLVSNGVYAAGGRVAPGQFLTNRVYLGQAITVSSVNGPAVTRIVGAADPAMPNGLGPAAVRCALVSENAQLIGFTLTNGHTRVGVDLEDPDGRGGGVLGYPPLSIVSNCIIIANAAHGQGGGSFQAKVKNSQIIGNEATYGAGAYYGTISNCLVASNRAAQDGGGIYNAAIHACIIQGNHAAGYGGGIYKGWDTRNCLIVENQAAWGGGCAESATYLQNCTVVGNTADTAGGTSAGSAINCIVYGNEAPDSSNYLTVSFSYSCTLPLPPGTGNIAQDPGFVAPSADNWRLLSSSPCVETGSNIWAPQDLDLDGHTRLYGVRVDMGAYEFYPAPLIEVTPAGQDFGLVPAGVASNLPFLVRNAADGILSGEASVAIPFSIESGDTYNLGPGQIQTVVVQIAVSGPGSYSNEVTFTGGGGATRPVVGTVYGPPAPPANIQATDGLYPDRVDVAWNPVPNALGYNIWRSTDADSAHAALLGSTDLTGFSDFATPAGTPCWYWIQATNLAGAGALSVSESGWRALPPNPEAGVILDSFDYPEGFSLAGKNGGMGWSSPWYGSGASNYVVPLVFSHVPGYPIQTGGAIRASGNSRMNREFPAISNGTVYVSFLLKYDRDVNAAHGVIVWEGGTSGRGLTINDSSYTLNGLALVEILDSGNYDWTGQNDVLATEKDYLVVGAVDLTGHTARALAYTSLVDSLPATEPTQWRVTKAHNLRQIGKIQIENQSAAFIDELRIATNWAELVAVPAISDADGDGLPDDWEDEHFDGPTNALPNQDDDEDGIPNVDELVLDTDPHSSNAMLAISALTAGSNTMIEFGATTNSRWYRLESATNMQGGAWIPFYGWVTGSNGVHRVIDLGGDKAKNYRVRVRRP